MYGFSFITALFTAKDTNLGKGGASYSQRIADKYILKTVRNYTK